MTSEADGQAADRSNRSDLGAHLDRARSALAELGSEELAALIGDPATAEAARALAREVLLSRRTPSGSSVSPGASTRAETSHQLEVRSPSGEARFYADHQALEDDVRRGLVRRDFRLSERGHGPDVRAGADVSKWRTIDEYAWGKLDQFLSPVNSTVDSCAHVGVAVCVALKWIDAVIFAFGHSATMGVLVLCAPLVIGLVQLGLEPRRGWWGIGLVGVALVAVVVADFKWLSPGLKDTLTSAALLSAHAIFGGGLLGAGMGVVVGALLGQRRSRLRAVTVDVRPEREHFWSSLAIGVILTGALLWMMDGVVLLAF